MYLDCCSVPSLVGLGQFLPSAIGQQYLRVHCLLQSGGQSTPTEYVMCMYAWVGGVYMCECTFYTVCIWVHGCGRATILNS